MKPSPASVVIEPAQSSDEPAIRAWLRQAALPDEDFANHLGRFLVARQKDGALVGAVGFELHGRDGLLRSLVVVPTLRGQGVGERLVEAIIVSVRAAGVTRLTLLTTTAEAFFAQRGFRKIPRTEASAAVAATPEFQSLCPVSAVCLTRELGR